MLADGGGYVALDALFEKWRRVVFPDVKKTTI
jgi:hypothetical protein